VEATRPHDPAQVGHQLGERVAEQVALGARRDVDREVAAGDPIGRHGLLAQVLDRALERGAEAPDLVVAAHVDADVDVAVGEPLGGVGDDLDRLREPVRDQQDRERDERQ
jgi:hypothetical protein